MNISNELIEELGMILREEFGLSLDQNKLNSLASFLVEYYQNLLSINNHK
ncbi:MAG TPA: hypothetical protein VIR55_06270 [Ignavibacteria bacterium]